MSENTPKLVAPKPLLAVKGLRIVPVVFKNNGAAVVTCSIEPDLPLGMQLTVENKTCVLDGAPMRLSTKTYHTITAISATGESSIASVEITVIEAPIKTQREAIIRVHNVRQDLDTPRSQVDNALSDQATMGSQIKPHEKFVNMPMGDDKRVSAQVADNPDAQMRARNNPELTPSPSQQLQAQAVNRMTPSSPAPTPGAK